MASHLDLEEQEQIDQIKNFWKIWGTLISSILIIAFGAVAVWNGYEFWKNRQAMQAAALFDAVENAAKAGDQERLEQSFSDISIKYPDTIQSSKAGLMVAKIELEKGRIDIASNALEWVAENSSDEGHRAVARLRLISLLTEQKYSENALKNLTNNLPIEFDGIFADRKGDFLIKKENKNEATKEYQRAYGIINKEIEYRRLVEVKLNSLGVKTEIASISSALKVGK